MMSDCPSSLASKSTTGSLFSSTFSTNRECKSTPLPGVFDEGNLAAYPSKVIPVLQYPGLQKWLGAGIDIVRVAVEETHKRRKEAFYVYRVNGTDWEDGKSWYLSPLKKAHPEWLTGYTWNFAVPEVRAHKLAILRELAENYDFDGIDLDFSRRPPHLPVGGVIGLELLG
jgi:uncharacterized lipoprotein YddW (UPF0748 family)